MIDTKQILTIGPEFNPPTGGVAQCVFTYGTSIFSNFRYLANSCNGPKVKKILKTCSSWIKFCLLLLLDEDIKIVHIHTASYNSFKRSSWFVNAAKTLDKKVVIHIHGGGFKEYYSNEKAFVNSVLKKCDALVTLSDSWKEFFEKIVGHKNVHVVPNIVDNPIIQDIEKDDKFHLLYLGHIYKEKGIFDLVDVINECHEKYKGKLILDIGGGMYEVEVLKKFIQDNKLEDVIHFHGWVSGDKKVELLNIADTFVLPSYTEGVPISILEAESYGLPILSTCVGGIPEVVHNGVNGFIFSPGDKDAIKRTIDKVFIDKPLRLKLGEESRTLCRTSLPLSVEERLKEVYLSI